MEETHITQTPDESVVGWKVSPCGFGALVACITLLAVACSAEEDEHREVWLRQAAYDSLAAAERAGGFSSADRLDSLFEAYNAPPLEVVAPDTSRARWWVDSTLAALTLDEKIGQLFIVNYDARGLRRLLGGDLSAVEEFGVGGFLLPRLLSPGEVFSVTTRLQRASRVPLFFAADYERGVGRFDNALTELPSNMAIGATRDTLFASAAGRLTATESRAIGVNLLFAPVVDVNNNPDNPIINIRSYGEDPELVGRMAAAYVRQAEGLGVLTTLKHFPGHGDTNVDSHARMGTVEGDSVALEETELHPYRTVLAETGGPAAIMTAHLWVEAFEPEPLPATFSRRLLHGYLRGELGYEGLVVTDDIKMGALSRRYPPAERVIRALQAGADIILTPESLEDAVTAVREAVEAGVLTERRIDESVRRILRAKAQAGLHEGRLADRTLLGHLLEEPLGDYIAQAIADRSVTLLRDAPQLPLGGHEGDRVALVHVTNYEGAESIEAAMDHFAGALGVEPAADVRLDDEPSAGERAEILAETREADVVVLALYLRLRVGRGEAGLLRGQHALVEALLRRNQPVVLVTFGNPYAAATYRDAEAIVVTYDQTLASVYAAARVLGGRATPTGRLPITVEPFSYGDGLSDAGP